MKDLTVKTLHKAVDYIINSDLDCCQCCAYLRAYTEEEMEKIPDDEEICVYRRTNGKRACRNGIIEYFQTSASRGK